MVAFAAILAGAASFGCSPGAGEARDLDASCQEGDAAACNELGYRVQQGQYVLADWRRASDLFTQACDEGEAEGCVRLARLHLHARAQSRGVSHDSMIAETLLEQGCDGGELSGCTDLAELYLEGRGSGDTGAAGLYLRACDGGEMLGCTRLGLLHEEGRGVESDPVRATDLHDRACNGGSPLGCTHLGQSYETGLGVDLDAPRAAGLYEGACEDEMLGCFRLAALYVDGNGVSQDPEQAIELFIKACYGTLRQDEGSPGIGESCFRAGDMIVNGVVDRPLWRASGYFRSACSRGYEDACGRS